MKFKSFWNVKYVYELQNNMRILKSITYYTIGSWHERMSFIVKDLINFSVQDSSGK